MSHIFQIDPDTKQLISTSFKVLIVNGIEIEDNISLGWLVLNMSNIDNFLYVTVILK